MPKLSVIIPVYNAQDYLRRCLESVCKQTLRDTEIICVNDCSKDNSIYILKEYAQVYPNIKVIDCKENGGESVARNIGLDNATGEYLAFVDNDDEIDLDFYEKLYNRALETNADIVKGNVKTIDYDGNIKESELNPQILNTNNKWYFHYEWWSAIYKTKLINENNIRLPEGYILGGDCLFLNKVLSLIKNIQVVNDTYYYWHRRENSGESKILSEGKVLSALKIFDLIFDNINELYIKNQIDKYSYDFVVSTCMWTPLEYMFRNNIFSSKETCSKYAIKFYNKCFRKLELEKYLEENYLLLKRFIVDNDSSALLDFIICFNTRNDFEKKNIFAKLRKGRLINA